MLRVFALFFCLGLVQAPALATPDRPVLVELFANQNCPACPKAHRAMHQIQAERDDVFILTWTVNYWDYLGEPDPMALDTAKDRQMAYTDRLSLRAPYTPQSFYDGAKECPGTRQKDIRNNISARLDLREEAAPDMTWTDGMLSVSAGDTDTVLEVSLVEYLTGDANETTMVNPVTKIDPIGKWSGEAAAFPVACAGSCAVLLHEQNVGEVLAVFPLR